MQCPRCASAVPVGARVCPWCGQVFDAPVDPPLAQGAAQCLNHPGRGGAPCARCGTFYCGECLPGGEPGKKRCAACEAREAALPWDRRQELGLWRAWWRTSLKVIASPMQTFQQAEPDAPLGSSLLLALLSTIAGMGTTFVFYGLVVGAVLIGVATGVAGKDMHVPELGGPARVGVGVGVAVFYAVLIVGFALGWMLAISAIELLVLRLLGHKGGTYSTSVRAHALAMGPYLVGLVPVCGLYVYPLWSLVLRIFAVQHLHRTTGGRAAGAVLIPVGTMVALCGLGYVLIFAAAMAAMAGAKGD